MTLTIPLFNPLVFSANLTEKAPGIQGNDGCDVIFHDIFINASGIMTSVIDHVLYLPFQTVLFESFLEPVQTLHGKGEIGLRCL